MHKEKKDKLWSYYIKLSIIGLLCTGVWTVYGHFAKTSIVERGFDEAAKAFKLIQQQFRIGAKDNDVTRAEGDVERVRNRIRFKNNDEPATSEEVEDVRIQEERLKATVKTRDELIRQYESKK